MKKFLAIVVLCFPAFGQTTDTGAAVYAGAAFYGAPVGGAPTFYAALPQLWVDNNELTCRITSSCYAGSPGLSLTAPAYELILGSSTWAGAAPPSYCSFSLPYATTAVGKQAAIAAIEACRTAGIANNTAIGIILDIPPGIYASKRWHRDSANQQRAGVRATDYSIDVRFHPGRHARADLRRWYSGQSADIGQYRT
jgi:hypothetical protein